MKLSIGMIVKNEAKYLRRCLESLQQIRDVVQSELIIVDTGSTDDTIEIAKEFTDKVYFHQWNNDFSEMRNITVEYSTGDWYFFIDGDEIISNTSGLIDFFVSGKYKDNNTACISIKSFATSENEDRFSAFLAPRLFKRNKDFCFKGPIHEQPNMKNPIIVLDSQIIHYGYVKDDRALMEKKFQRTTTMLIKELEKNPGNVYYLYQLSVSYGMHGDKEEALQQIQKAFDIVKLKKFDFHMHIYIYMHIIKSYLVNGKYKEAENVCLEIIRDDSMYIDIFFYIAKAQLMMNKNEEAIKNYKIYLEMRKNVNDFNRMENLLVVYYTIGKFEEAYFDLSILYERQGDYEIALQFAKKVLSEDALAGTFNQIILVHAKLNKYSELRSYYNKVISINGKFKDMFINTLESYLSHANRDKVENILKVFSEDDSEYALLNIVRLSKEKLSKEVINQIYTIDFNKLPNYFGDFIYYMVTYKVSISEILNKTHDFKIRGFFLYIINSHENFSTKLYEYLMGNIFKEQVFDVIRENKIMAFYSLSSESIDELQYKKLFNMYLKWGWSHLEKVYSSEVIENELVNFMKDEEDLFLMYMRIAQNNKSNKAIYIRNLRNALNANNYMKRGIEILLKEIKDDIVPQNNEMEVYMEKVKESISELINTNNIKDAKLLIEEYQSIIEEDFEISSMKAVISIMENKLEDAESILITALKSFSDNFDLTYNLAYVYDQMDNKQKALYFYKKAVNLVSELPIAVDINIRIESLEKELCK